MDEEREEPSEYPAEPPAADRRRWDTTSLLTGILLGAAVGAGLALLFAPADGEDTRRLLRRRARAVTRGAAEGWVGAREDARDLLRSKKEALRERFAKGLERLQEVRDR